MRENDVEKWVHFNSKSILQIQALIHTLQSIQMIIFQDYCGNPGLPICQIVDSQ